jgi:hypothetical protein
MDKNDLTIAINIAALERHVEKMRESVAEAAVNAEPEFRKLAQAMQEAALSLRTRPFLPIDTRSITPFQKRVMAATAVAQAERRRKLSPDYDSPNYDNPGYRSYKLTGSDSDPGA